MSKTITVTLGGRALTLSRTNRTTYRINSLKHSDNPYTLMVNWLWALQTQPNVRNTPEDIAEVYESGSEEEKAGANQALNNLLGFSEPGESKAESSKTSQESSSVAESALSNTGN
ncbi:MAG: hypothetical protein HRU10_09345 [Opitutales bacterium]|nr:hypothetical protein [Opitutales bacterium]